MPNITNIPSARVQIIDPATSLISPAWYRFFLNLFQLTGSGSSDVTLEDLQLGPPVIAPQDLTNYLAAPSAITVTASPFTYINTTGYPADIIVSGGGVILLEFSRNGVTFFNTGSFYGMFTLSPYDRLRVTYQTPPQMTLVPR